MSEIHIGERIQAVVKERGMTINEFARRINCERTTVYNIFKRSSIHIDQLSRISKALNFDFIKEFYLHQSEME